MKISIQFSILLIVISSCNRLKNEEKSVEKSVSITEIEKDINESSTGVYDFWKFEEGIESNFSNYNDYFTTNAVVQTITKDTIITTLIKNSLIVFKKKFASGEITYYSQYKK